MVYPGSRRRIPIVDWSRRYGTERAPGAVFALAVAGFSAVMANGYPAAELRHELRRTLKPLVHQSRSGPRCW
jgi:hypothetical protein